MAWLKRPSGDLVINVRLGVSTMFHCRNQNGAVSLSWALKAIKGAIFVALFSSMTIQAAEVNCGAHTGQSFASEQEAQAACTTDQTDTAAVGCTYHPGLGTDVTACTSGDNQFYFQTGDNSTGSLINYFHNYSYPPPPPPPCASLEGSILKQSGDGELPATICVGQCSYVRKGVSVILGNPTGWASSFEGTGEACSGGEDMTDPSTELFNSETNELCSTANGVEVCYDMTTPDAAADCVSVDGQYICDGVVTYSDCYTVDSGAQICNSGADTGGTSGSPIDPTTGEPVTPDQQTATTNTTGSSGTDTNTTSSKNVYSSATVSANNAYSCDNPDTATWEPCPGFCDNPNTVTNECSQNDSCIDDPNTLYDESSICTAMQSQDCGGFMQPPCDAQGNPVTIDTTAGNLTTADGLKISGSIESLGDSLTKGWSEPVNQGRGSLDQVTADSDVLAIRADYEATLNQIRTEASSFFNLTTSAGQLPCWTNLSLPGLPGTYSMCPRNYESQLAIIGVILLAIATLLAFIVLMR